MEILWDLMEWLGLMLADLRLLSQCSISILFPCILRSILEWMMSLMVLQYLKAEGGEPVEKAWNWRCDSELA